MGRWPLPPLAQAADWRGRKFLKTFEAHKENRGSMFFFLLHPFCEKD